MEADFSRSGIFPLSRMHTHSYSNSEMILVLEKRLEEFSRSKENRFLSAEDQIIGARDTNRKSNNMSDSGFCLDLLKNQVFDLERQVTEKHAIISFLSKQLIKAT